MIPKETPKELIDIITGKKFDEGKRIFPDYRKELEKSF